MRLLAWSSTQESGGYWTDHPNAVSGPSSSAMEEWSERSLRLIDCGYGRCWRALGRKTREAVKCREDSENLMGGTP